ncbi:MAG: formate dehydrogenase accessory sulfurtransferase FdhD [Pseudomonadaceae bacterium]|nr:MAG: formate dehydrogenase accessory sulfurtransferase FdhD [Pseudomonadaceae bacterium]
MPLATPAPATTFHFVSLDTPEHPQTAHLVAEVAVAINYNGLNHAVMMASPQDLEDFACGFSLGQGIISATTELLDLDILLDEQQAQVAIQLSSRRLWQLKQQRRQLAGTAGCGLCGTQAIEQALPQLTPLPESPLPARKALEGLRERLACWQTQAHLSGAMHAAAFVDQHGDLQLCREDIGRHNALDKLIGALARQHIPCQQGFAVITSRCSLELIHKAVRAGLPTLVSLSAPSQLSVHWARQLGLNLIHLPHHSAPRVYHAGQSQ